MPLLLWMAIQESKLKGAKVFSLGRSDEHNAGLIAFKSHWTEHSTPLVYWRCPGPVRPDSAEGWRLGIAKRVFSFMPKHVQAATGRLIYRHIG